jgi:hypothetical protein
MLQIDSIPKAGDDDSQEATGTVVGKRNEQ